MIQSFFQVARRYASAVQKTLTSGATLWHVATVFFDSELGGKDGSWVFQTVEASQGWQIETKEVHQ